MDGFLREIQTSADTLKCKPAQALSLLGKPSGGAQWTSTIQHATLWAAGSLPMRRSSDATRDEMPPASCTWRRGVWAETIVTCNRTAYEQIPKPVPHCRRLPFFDLRHVIHATGSPKISCTDYGARLGQGFGGCLPSGLWLLLLCLVPNRWAMLPFDPKTYPEDIPIV